MSFLKYFIKLITFPECTVSCWEDSHGVTMEHTELIYQDNHLDTIVSKWKNPSNESFPRDSHEFINENLNFFIDQKAHADYKSLLANSSFICSKGDIQIAANLQKAIEQITAAYEQAVKNEIIDDVLTKENWEPDSSDTLAEQSFEQTLAEHNLKVIKKYCDFLVDTPYNGKNRQCYIDSYWVFRSSIISDMSSLYTVPIPTLPTLAKDTATLIYELDMDFNQLCENHSNRRIIYHVNNLFQYCFALLDYLISHNCRLAKCSRCKRYYVPPRKAHNSAYCDTFDASIGVSCLELSKMRKLPNKHKKIYNRLRQREDEDGVALFFTYMTEVAAHQQQVKDGFETLSEFELWLDQQDKALRKHPK